MQDFLEFFANLFNTKGWVPRWVCGRWSETHGWTYITSSLLIWAAYFSIPFTLYRLVKKKGETLPFPKIFWLFILFIFACGITHLVDAIMFWYPAYRLSATLLVFTAIVSWAAVIGLYKIVPLVLTLKTPSQYEEVIAERTKELETSNKNLKKLNEELQEAHAATKSLMRQKDEFMSIASHELKTPITSMKANLQLTGRLTAEKPEYTSIAPFVEKANKQVNKLTSLVEDLLDVTRIQAGKLQFNRCDFYLKEVLDDCVEQAKSFSDNHKILVKGDASLKINGDKARIEQVITNLLSNAVKYSPDANEVLLQCEQSNGHVNISVTDFGIGISGDKLPFVFDRFFRAREAHTFSGLGLGLYISSEIVKRHGGEIGVESAEGKGSTFWLQLPVNGHSLS
jgi:signal transduction histidine kinase